MGLNMPSWVRRWVQRLRAHNELRNRPVCMGIHRYHAFGEEVLVPEWCYPYQPSYKVTCERCGSWYCWEPPNR